MPKWELTGNNSTGDRWVKKFPVVPWILQTLVDSPDWLLLAFEPWEVMVLREKERERGWIRERERPLAVNLGHQCWRKSEGAELVILKPTHCLSSPFGDNQSRTPHCSQGHTGKRGFSLWVSLTLPPNLTWISNTLWLSTSLTKLRAARLKLKKCKPLKPLC